MRDGVGWGGEAAERDLAYHHSLLRHPTPLATRATLPLQGRVKQARTTPHSRDGIRPSFVNSFRPQKERGRREDRVRAAPEVSCAKAKQENAHEHTGSAEAVRPSLRNGFTAYIVLSPARPGLLVTVVPKKRELLANLTPAIGASGPHDFAVRITRCSSKAHPRPPLPAPTSVTMANAPSLGAGWQEVSI